MAAKYGEGLAAARDPSSFLKGRVHFPKLLRYFTIHGRIFWTLQSLGWLLMLVVAMSVVGHREEKLLQFVDFRNALGFLLTAFLLRPFLRWWRRRHVAAPLRQVPILIGLTALFGFADARISFYVFILFSNVQATAERSRLYFESTNTLRSGLYAIWVSLYVGINCFILKSGVDYRMRWPRKGATQMAPFQGSVSLGA